jgi:hypothetical protein
MPSDAALRKTLKSIQEQMRYDGHSGSSDDVRDASIMVEILELLKKMKNITKWFGFATTLGLGKDYTKGEDNTDKLLQCQHDLKKANAKIAELREALKTERKKNENITWKEWAGFKSESLDPRKKRKSRTRRRTTKRRR